MQRTPVEAEQRSIARYIDVHAPGDSARRHVFGRALVWIGCASTGKLEAKREVPNGRVEAEFVPEPEGVRVSKTQGGRLRLVFHGVETGPLTVPWGDEIFLEDTRLVFVEVARESSANRLALLGGVLALALAAVLLVPQGAASSSASEPPIPDLFDTTSTVCSTQGTASAARAFEAERLARAKQQRYPFDASEGVPVLALFQEASACFRDAGRVRDSQQAAAELASFQARLASDFAALRVRLSAARAANRPEPALAATRELLPLLGSQPDHPYARWLADLERELGRKVAKPR